MVRAVTKKKKVENIKSKLSSILSNSFMIRNNKTDYVYISMDLEDAKMDIDMFISKGIEFELFQANSFEIRQASFYKDIWNHKLVFVNDITKLMSILKAQGLFKNKKEGFD